MFLLVITLSLFFSVCVIAEPPSGLGVEGKVYYINTEVEVFEGVPVTVTNLNTSEVVVGKTGLGSSGRFSFVLNWEKDHSINISASNPFHSTYVVKKLNGSIRNLFLDLNMTFDNVPPEFLSTPSTEALAEHEYSYLIKTFDWNNDEVSLSLVEAPSNMSLVDNMISWIPERGDFGNHSVIINASDNENYTLQEFVLEVFVINEAPNIVSTPVTNVMRNELYEYEVLVIDDDYEFLEYTVFRGPSGMYFNGNVLTFVMDDSHEGEYVVIIDIFDRFGEVGRQIFLLMIDEPEPVPRRSPGRFVDDKNIEINEKDITVTVGDIVVSDGLISISGVSVFDLSALFKKNVFEKDFVVRSVFIDSDDFLVLSIGETNPLNERIKSTSTRTYKFFFIRSDKVVVEDVVINFIVDDYWLNITGLSPEDIVLIKFVNGSWVELPTNFLNKEGSNYLFESVSPGLSLFAITHKKDAVVLERPVLVNTVTVNKIVTGKIVVFDDLGDDLVLSFDELKKLKNNLKLKMTNQDSGDEFFVELFILGNNLFFQENIEGDDFIVELFVKKDILVSEHVSMKEFVNEINIALNKDDVNFVFRSDFKLFYLVFALMFFLSFIFIVWFVNFRGRRGKKNV